LEEQQRVIALAERSYALLAARGLPHGKPFTAQAESGPRPASFNLVSALYHVSGATSFTFECPHGIDDPKACQVNLEQILDIQLTLYEAMMQFALEAKANSAGPLDQDARVGHPAGVLSGSRGRAELPATGNVVRGQVFPAGDGSWVSAPLYSQRLGVRFHQAGWRAESGG
jgi:hypothetical protein